MAQYLEQNDAFISQGNSLTNGGLISQEFINGLSPRDVNELFRTVLTGEAWEGDLILHLPGLV